MNVCVECGRPAGAARFCSGCGHPVAPADARRTDTAERPAVRASLPPAPPAPPPARGPSTLPPPPAFQPPPPARYPLFADQVEAVTPRTVSPARVAAGPVAAPPTAPPPPPAVPQSSRRRSGSWLPLGVTLVALALVAMTGALLLTSGTEDPAPAVADAPAPGAAPEVTPADAVPDGPTLTPSKPDRPDRRRPVDVTAGATVQAPRTAAPQQDVRGATVSYAAANMVDGAARTSWRMPGDGTGQEIVIRLAEPTRLTEVGLINGYAKVDGRFDWYAGNRRVRAVEWRFDDGTVVRQALRDDRGVQTTRIDPVTARTVRLRLLSVTGPGTGPSGRDFTAISELALLGTPG